MIRTALRSISVIAGLVIVAMVIGIVLIGFSIPAAGEPPAEGADEVKLIDETLVIEDAVFAWEHVSVVGPGVPDTHIDRNAYLIENAEFRIYGLHLTWDDTVYTVCDVTIKFDNIGFVLEDITLKDGNPDVSRCEANCA
ncbi:hypothetical protein [Halegenticoccus tardaugens]|uniref:hypothetical protein n=1 Tax=Halegenticoccus tardaugens TaxID=2071624 RepID=UPI00100A2DAB|nr:hypothetical protein [Halegenticoccus tardaugens]